MTGFPPSFRGDNLSGFARGQSDEALKAFNASLHLYPFNSFEILLHAVFN